MFYVIIRGPAAVGKSTISKIVAERIGALYISFDEILSKYNLDTIEGDGISVDNFVKGNEIALDMIKQLKPKTILLDGCFYREGQMEHILKNIKGKHFIFTLKAKVDECVLRNRQRGNSMPEGAIYDVFKLVSKKDYGIVIDTSGKTINQVVEEILSHLPLKKAM
jgi:cytidylate kinase